MKKIKEFLLRTSSQFAISSILIMVLIFSAVAFNVYQKLSDYITEQSASAIDTLITQTQERLNSTLHELDSNMQQFCNAMLVQEALYSNSYKNQITSTQLAAVRRQIMQTVAYNDAIDNIELFSTREMIYPFTRASIDQTLSSAEIALADQQNGKIVWLSNPDDSSHTIRAVKRIILPDYDFSFGGYLVFTPKNDFLDFLEKDFKDMNGMALTLSDSNEQKIYQYSNLSDTAGSELPQDPEAYKIVQSHSPYTGWNLTFYVSQTLQSKDIPWLLKTLLLSFSVGGLIFFIACIFICRMISSPLKDMEKVMAHTEDRLQPNLKKYSNTDINNLNASYNAMVDANNQLIEEVYEKELLRTQAEIKALQAQVNPHFIINALESLYWVMIQNGDLKNAEVLLSLARLFQYILKGKDWISLDEELHFIEQYLQIEKFRFGHKLSWNYEVNEMLKEIKIPKLFIHPLVENAVKYAVETTTKNVEIHIEIKGTPTDYQVIVSDNGNGIPPETMQKILLSFKEKNPVGSVSSSYGLANLYKRIQLYYGKNSSLTITTVPQFPGTQVKMRIQI